MTKLRHAVRRNRARPSLELLEDRTTPATLPTGFTEAAVATGLSSATAMEVAPNGDLWVLEQGGAVKRFRPGSTTADLVANLSPSGLRSEGERGVLGIAFDPNYATNKFVYIYYTSSDAPNPHNRISRFTVNDANATDYCVRGHHRQPRPPRRGRDPQPRPALDGDQPQRRRDPLRPGRQALRRRRRQRQRGQRPVAHQPARQDPAHQRRRHHPGRQPHEHRGHRRHHHRREPRPSGPSGLRNPFTFTFQPGTGRMFINDVGQNTWEEVNVGGAGRNFGWPGTEGDFNQAIVPELHAAALRLQPHGGGTFQGFAITGGAFYNPTTNQFPAEYAGDYFFADFVNDWINVMNADGTGVRRFATGAPGTVDLRVAADGSLLYLARDASQVFRVTFTGSQAPAITQQPQNATVSAGGNATFTVAASGTPPLAYQWQKLQRHARGRTSPTAAACPARRPRR